MAFFQPLGTGYLGWKILLNLVKSKEKDMYNNFVLINKENTKGITLIVLVVTIIVLLILAGLGISFTIRRRWNIKKSTRRDKNLSKCELQWKNRIR